MEWIPINLARKSGSNALQIRYNVISFKGQFSFVPPVPNLTESMPSFFNALIIFLMVTGLVPVESDRSSLVTFFFSPYSLIKMRQWMAMEHFVLICMIGILLLIMYAFYHKSSMV